MENRIKLWSDGVDWRATFIGPWAREVVEMWGTDTLPTPYKATAPAARVLALVRSRNPLVPVDLAVAR